MNVLVTGGAGYIGSVMTEVLLGQGHHVVVYDNLCKGHQDAVPAGAVFEFGDVGDAAGVEAVLRHHAIDGVIHMAAYIEVGESVSLPSKYFENNALRPVALLEAMVATGVRLFVLSSTAAVYAPQEQPLVESSPLSPASPYGLSKLFLEQTLAWYATRGIVYCALRYFNAAGATEQRGERHRPETHLIPLVLAAAAGERPAVQIYGTDYDTPDGTCLRDYIHVADLADAHVLALEVLRAERDGAAPPAAPASLAERAYNLGNGAGYSVREVIASVERVCGLRVPVVAAPRRPGDPPRLVACSARMQALGWQPRFPDLDQIVASAWRFRQQVAAFPSARVSKTAPGPQ